MAAPTRAPIVTPRRKAATRGSTSSRDVFGALDGRSRLGTSSFHDLTSALTSRAATDPGSR